MNEPAQHDLVRSLPILVPLIKEELEEGEKAGLEHYRRAGEMLIEAKEQVNRGEWDVWLKRNFALSATTARKYMRLVLVTQKEPRRSFSTLSAAVDPPRPHHQPVWHEPVRNALSSVNIENLKRQQQERDKENKLVAQLKGQIIDIGYKVLATKLHPDKGGSAAAMSRLNRAKTELKGCIR